MRFIEPSSALPFWDLLRRRQHCCRVTLARSRSPMLRELAVRDLALIERARVAFGPA